MRVGPVRLRERRWADPEPDEEAVVRRVEAGRRVVVVVVRVGVGVGTGAGDVLSSTIDELSTFGSSVA